MADFTEAKADVSALKSVVPSVVALLDGVAAQVDAAVAANDAGDNTQLASLSADIKAQADALAAAVVKNTPAATA
jgi:hypothetical protein